MARQHKWPEDYTPFADQRFVDAAVDAERAACAKIAEELSRASVFQLHAGEMTAQERRSVSAVAKLIARKIRDRKETT